MGAARILLQLDPDVQASTFDAVVAWDAGVDHLLTRSLVQAEQVRSLVHGVLFTRSIADLRHSAIFIGGSDVTAGERLLQAVQDTFFGPFRVSVLLDSNGANTTAAAAVLVIERHLPVADHGVLVLGGTGPVGMRVARLLWQRGAAVWLASRRIERAEAACRHIEAKCRGLECRHPLTPVAQAEVGILLKQSPVQAIVSAGAAGTTLLAQSVWTEAAHSGNLRVMVDLNAVPPPGIEAVEPADKAVVRHQVTCYGALAVGGLKMKIHRRAIQALFEANDRILDAEAVLELGRQLETTAKS